MDIGISSIVTVIVDSTTDYLAVYSPIFLLIGGIILAIGVVSVLISLFSKKKVDVFGDDDDIM